MRLVEILVPERLAPDVEEAVAKAEVDWSWHQSASGNSSCKLLLAAEDVEKVLDALHPLLGSAAESRVLVLPLEACLPAMEEASQPADDEPPAAKASRRISREELLSDVQEQTSLNSTFLVNAALSAVVAVIGLSRDNAVVVLSAMVIAPLLGPNMAFAVAIILGHFELMKKAVKASVAGIATAASIAALTCWVWPLELDSQEVRLRTVVDLGDVVLGLAAGSAGALALLAGSGLSLVGVMVAVALLPPLAVSAGLAVQGDFALALNALVLLAVNTICVHLSGVVVFSLHGVRPRGWFDLKRSARVTRTSLAILTLLLAAAIVLLVVRGL